MMNVRQAVLDDTAAITTIYRSTVPRWVNAVQEESPYDQLSLHERWSHGGPWMSMETCAIWLGHLLQQNDGIPLVAEVAGEVIGHTEVFIGKEPEPYGHHINISTLCVRQDHQREGVGTALVNYILQMAKVINCQQVTVAYADPAAFFEKLDFTPQIPRYRVTMPTQEGRVFYRAQEMSEDDTSQINQWLMPLGRFQNGREEWERMRWYIWNGVPLLVQAEWKRLKIELTGQPGILHLHQHDDDPTCATARLWTKNPFSAHMLAAVKDRAVRLGYERISTLVEESIRPILGDVESGQPQWLYARQLR